MKIKILESAIEDLKRSHDFYEKLNKGLGSYFIDTLFSDIDSLQLYGRYIKSILVTTECYQKDFLLPFIIKLKKI